jgi:hypothetical protein
LAAAIEKFRDYIAQETLATHCIAEPLPGIEPVTTKVLEHELALYLRVMK